MTEQELQALQDERNSYCRRHGGTASFINCWECYAEFREDE